MKKTLLATAIAGTMAASGAHAATIYNEDGTKVDLYGNIQLALSDVEQGDGTSEDGLNDNGTTVGINASHLITRDLTGYMKLEFEVDAADEIKGSGRGLNDGDQAFVGVEGNFGDLRIGSWDPIIDDWAQDKITNNEFADVSDSTGDAGSLADAAGFDVDREGDKVQYASPSMNGFDFALGFQFKGDGDRSDNSTGATLNNDGSTDPAVAATYEQDEEAAFFGGVRYTVGGLQLAAIYDSLDAYSFDGIGAGNEDVSAEAYALSAVYGFGATTLAGKYERTDLDFGSDDGEVDRYGLSASHAFNFGDIYAGYQFVDAQDAAFIVDENYAGATQDEEYNEFTIGANYGISDNMYVWAETGVFDRVEDDGDFVATGVVYSF
ncbi:porin [Vreelandella arcis]|uniref:Outer membrane protein (Porin) n=1 Tax=Vreelandella arcis TaxID=416873 RepID=A0A1H0CW41_9GAMM|nr:porin [Halomonas arcis]SDN61996.1 Outer membrane protein (porin) [Halomonas arcis]